MRLCQLSTGNRRTASRISLVESVQACQAIQLRVVSYEYKYLYKYLAIAVVFE